MNERQKTILILLIFGAFFVTGAKHKSKLSSNENSVIGALREIDLSSEQRQRIDKIWQQKDTKIAELYRSLDKLEDELVVILKNDGTDQQLHNLFLQKEKLRDQAAKLNFDCNLDIRKVLTKSQRHKFHQSIVNSIHKKREKAKKDKVTDRSKKSS